MALTPTLTLDDRIAWFRSRIDTLKVPCAFVAILGETLLGRLSSLLRTSRIATI